MYTVTFGYQAVDTKIPESRMAQSPASLVGLLKGNMQIFSLSRGFVTALLTLLCQMIDTRIQIMCGQQIVTFNIFLGVEKIEAPLPLLAFRDEKGCYMTQEIGGVRVFPWIRVLLGSALEVVGVGRWRWRIWEY